MSIQEQTCLHAFQKKLKIKIKACCIQSLDIKQRNTNEIRETHNTTSKVYKALANFTNIKRSKILAPQKQTNS